jgi:hypothetical protein
MGRTDPTRWEQEHGGGRQQGYMRGTNLANVSFTPVRNDADCTA